MRNLINAVLTATLVLVSSFSFAAKYEITELNSNANQVYPNLDLNGLEKVILTTSEGAQETQTVTRAEFIFPHANNLIVSNFKKRGNMFVGIANGAWVFKQIKVELDGLYILEHGQNINFRIAIVEDFSYLTGTSYHLGPVLVEANGHMKDITPKKLADITSLKLEGKKLTLKLFQKPRRTNENGEGFVIQANWIGHGEEELTLSAPVPSNEFHKITARKLILRPYTNQDGIIENIDVSIRYKDEYDNVYDSPTENLLMILEGEYPPAP
ncbi:hypothetical protein [Litoribacillus peritrichatus]|uniref:Uncharacterized protein n=1 Tax=Litoribacillus peritrichatus TaxID=718191 RepID=A0ABP7MFR3_9GAMM